MPTVMIVHQSWLIRTIVSNELSESGYRVVCGAKSRLEASIAYRLHKPDVVLLDVTTNGDRGQETLKDILQIDPQAAVIVIVDKNTEAVALRATLSGARGMLFLQSEPAEVGAEILRVLHTAPQTSSLRAGTPEPIGIVSRVLSHWRLRRPSPLKEK